MSGAYRLFLQNRHLFPFQIPPMITATWKELPLGPGSALVILFRCELLSRPMLRDVLTFALSLSCWSLQWIRVAYCALEKLQVCTHSMEVTGVYMLYGSYRCARTQWSYRCVHTLWKLQVCTRSMEVTGVYTLYGSYRCAHILWKAFLHLSSLADFDVSRTSI